MASAPAEPLLTFRVANERFALPARAVREVVRPSRVTRVPHAPESLIGLVNLRGKVLPVVAAGALLGHEVTSGGRVVVLERAHPVGLLVDEVSAVAASALAGARMIDFEPLLGKAFDEVGMARQSARLGAVSALERQEVSADEVVLLSFEVSGQEYALPIDQVEEVMRLPDEVTVLPMADAVALGTVARGGRLLPLLSLRLLLDLEAAAGEKPSQVLVVRIGAHSVGLVVDAIQSILRVPESAIDPVPAVLARGNAEARIQAISRLDGGARLVSILATDHLLSTELTGRLHDTNDEEQAMADEGSDVATQQFLVFRIGEQDFGLPISAVREVTTMPPKLTRLPKAPAFVQGMINLRGRVIPVIDQGQRFERGAVKGRKRRIIVTALGTTEAGFLVDSVSEVLRIPVNAIAPAPELADERTRMFDRVANLDADGRMILIVEPQELLDRAERDLLAAMF